MAIMAGTAFGQVLAVAVSPVLSRLYTPSDFGVFSVVNALAVVLGTVLAGRYELAIPLPEEDEDARALFVVGMVLTVAATAVATVAFFSWAPLLADLLDAPGAAGWLVWVPLVAATLAAFRLLNQWALRQQRYSATARRNVVSSASTVLIQVLSGWRAAGPGGLIAGLGLGQALGAASLLMGSRISLRTTWAEMRRVARRYRRFPSLLAPSGLLNSAGLYLPLVLIASIFGTEAAGWLGFTQRILALPVTLVGQAVAQVYLGELARAHRDGGDRQERLFHAASVRLALIGIAFALFLLAAAQPLFPWIFGEAWQQSGAIAQALAVSLALQLVASPLSQTLVVYERTVMQLTWDIGRLMLVTVSVMVTAAAGGDVIACVWAFSGASAGAYTLSWWLSRQLVKKAAPPRSAATT
jgi:O-antigen/teichoic acid export membrane protein